MSARKRGPACYTIDVDGQPASVRLGKPPEELGEDALETLRDIIRAARRKMEAGK